MACPSCCVDLASDVPSEIVRLTWDQLRHAIDTFMDPKEVPYAAEKYIVFAGGETFLDYPNLIKAAQHCQRFPVKPRLFMYTNGEPTGFVGDYLNWIKSDEGQCIILEKGYAPANEVSCE